MSCNHPNYLLQVDFNDFEELMIYRSKGFKCNPETMRGVKFLGSVDKLAPFYENHTNSFPGKFVEVPCGKCLGCRLDYARFWASRCYLESLEFKDNYFITLTYDDDHLPENNSLVVDDIMTFIKRLRNYFHNYFKHDNIRYLLCGEYGEQSLRPHYHLIVFNVPLYDLDINFPYDDNGKTMITQHVKNGHVYYYSDLIHALWSKGNVLIGDVTLDSCGYVARYVTKKQTGKASKFYKDFNLVPPFIRMSTRPGIAYNYFIKNYKQIYKYDCVIVPGRSGPVRLKPGRYFDKLLFKVDPDFYWRVKVERELEFSARFQSHLLLDPVSYHLARETNDKLLEDRAKMLLRNL